MKYMLRTILDRVLLEARQAGTLKAELENSYEIIFPEIDVEDHQILASATQTLVTALSTAKTQGWISDETAMRLLFQFAGEEVDLAQERARIQREESH